MDPFIGSILDRRFRVDEKIAAGGFGVIYRATHVKSAHEVALKMLHPAMASNERVVARFRREGATLTTLRSPHTVTTYEIVEDAGGILFMVMELLRGETLLQRFQTEGALPWRRVVEIGRAVCESLAEAHALGIVHRDLKPENIHLEPRDGEPDLVKVLDFGIAKVLKGSGIDRGEEDLTAHNEVIGTADYVSPEQIMGGESYSGRTDIYTLAVVMYEMMTGSRPFAHVSGPALLATILTTSPSPPSSRMVGIPPELDRVILQCLEHDPNKRFVDVDALAHALDTLLEVGDEGATRSIFAAPPDAASDDLDQLVPAPPRGSGTKPYATPPPLSVLHPPPLPTPPPRSPLPPTPPPLPPTPPPRPPAPPLAQAAPMTPNSATLAGGWQPPMFDPNIASPVVRDVAREQRMRRLVLVVLVFAIVLGIVLAIAV